MSPAEESPTARRQVWLVTIAGVVTATLGLVVMTGWHTHTVPLIQVLPTLVPMQYNTALGFLLSGTGLIALAHDRPRVAMVTGSLVGAIGLLTLVEYVFGVPLGIDELLLEAYITVQTSTPGRMAPNTALSFCLAAGALLSHTVLQKPYRRFWLIGGFGSLLLVLGSVALFGYLTGAQTAFGWGRLTRMAVHTSIGFMALAVGILVLAFREGSTWVSSSDVLTPETLVRDRRRILAGSVAIMTVASLAVGVSITRELYSAGLDAQRDRLKELVLSRVTMIEAVARFDLANSQDVPGGARVATRRQLIEAHERSPGFGDTGEFTLASLEGEEIVFLARPPNAGLAFADRLGPDDPRAEPMRRALEGESGSLIGTDYRGEVVIAAYTYVPSLELGIVAKMDLAEIRAPFVRSSILTAGITLIIIVIGVAGTVISIGPLTRRVESHVVDRQLANIELTRARDELIRREGLLGTTGSLARVGGWEVDAGTLAVTWTDETYRIHDVDVGDGTGLEDALDFYHVDDRHIVEEAVQRALANGEAFDVEARLTTAKGKQLWTRSICEVVIVDGRTVKLVGAFQDITEAKRQQRAITMSQRIATVFLTSEDEETYDRLVAVICEALGSPCGCAGYVDGDGDLVCRSETLDGPNPFLQADGSDVFLRADWSGLWEGSLLRQETVMVNEGLPSPDGSAEMESALMVPIVHQGTLIGHYAVANKPGGYTDPDCELLESAAHQTAPILYARLERARQERKHEALEERYRHSQRMEAVGQLAGGVAHDFNNLLQVIQGFGEIALLKAENDPTIQDPVEEMLKASDRAKKLVAQLLAFSRRQVLKLEAIDLNEMIASEADMLRRVIGEHIKLDVLPQPNVGTVRADRGQLAQILINLCLNARDSMPGGGTLTIEVENVRFDAEYCESHPGSTPGRYALLSVTDTGVGIEDAILGNIFEPFFTTKEAGHGTGLGLATVYGLVKQHGGMIQVYSEVGKGTTFKVYLPISERLAADVGDKIEGPVPGGTETILVAEDDEMVLQLTKDFLEDAGYTVIASRDGEEALRLLEEHADVIDLALLDVVMPKLGGRAVFERIRKEYPEVRVLFSSGYSINAIHTNFVLDEGLTLLQKPHSRAELLRKVREVLDQEE